MSALRVGLWGVGAHARKNLIPALEACGDTELVLALRRSGQSLPGINVTDDVEQFLAADIDVVVVAGPTGLHATHARRALETGHHVWSEKPAATSYSDAQRLVDHAAEAGLVFLESDMFLHHPQWAAVREAMGRLGRVDSMTARFGFPHLSSDNIRYDPTLGGGALDDAGFYPLGAATDLLGERIAVKAAQLADEPGFDVDVRGSALAVDASGMAAHMEWGFGRAYRSEVEIWGEDGWVRAERVFAKPGDLATTVVLRRSDGSSETIEIPPADHFVGMFRDFAEVTIEGQWDSCADAMLTRARIAEEIRRIAL